MSPVKLVGKIRRGRLANNGKSKMAAPSHDFSQILEEMQKASETGWDSLVNVCYEIRKVVGEFSFKESMVDEINVDFYAQQIDLGSKPPLVTWIARTGLGTRLGLFTFQNINKYT